MNTMPQVVKRLSGFAAVASLAIALQGCGGDGEHADAELKSTERRVFALASNATEVITDGLVVTQLQKVAEIRVGRSVYDYTFKVTIENRARTNARGVELQLATVGAGSSIIDGSVRIGVVRAVGAESPDDSVTIRHDRTKPFDSNALKWNISVDTTPARLSGRLIDRAVKNAYFQTASGHGGFTDGTGAFYYDVPGELVEFSIGGRTAFGTAAAAPTVHVHDLTTDMGRALPGDRVAQLLQSLDLSPGTSVLTLPELAQTQPPTIDFFAPTQEFETGVSSLLAAYQVPRTAIVPIETARAEARNSIASINCPIVVAPPVRDGGVFEHDPSKLTCLEKARIEFFARRVKSMMNSTLDEGLAQVNLIDETFSATAVEKIIDDSPLLATVDASAEFLNTLDELLDAEAKGEAARRFTLFSTKAAAWVANVAAQSKPVSDDQDIAKWTAQTSVATTVLFDSVECVQWWGAKEDKRKDAMAACANVLAPVLGVAADKLDMVALELAAAELELFAELTKLDDVASAKGKKALRGGAQLTAALIKTAAKTSEFALLQAKRNNKNPSALLEGVSHALNTGVSELATGLANCAGIKKSSAGAIAACRMSAVSLTSKALIRSSMLSVGVGEGVAAAGRITDTRVAVGMLEDLLYAGAAGRASLFYAYGANDDKGLARSMGQTKYGYESVRWDVLMARKLGNIIQGQLIFNPDNVAREVAFWKNYIDSQVQPEFSSTGILITATVTTDRLLVANVSFDAAKLDVAGGELVCRSIGAADDTPIVVAFDQAQAAAGVRVETTQFPLARIATLVCSVYEGKRLIATQSVSASLDAGAGTIAGLVGHYTFDDCNAKDSSGLGRHGSILGACIDSPKGKAYRLSNGGTNLYGGIYSMDIPPHTAAAITFSTWVKWEGAVSSTDTHGYAGALWSLGVHTQQPFMSIWINEGGSDGAGGKIWTDRFIDSPFKLVPNVWTMLSISSDGQRETLYVNGEAVNSVTYPSSQSYLGLRSYLARHFWVDAGNPWAARFRGVLDDVRVYDRSLSASEVRQLYRATRF